MRKLDLLLLSGGKGTRISSMHPDVPKPMIKVLDQPFLYWVTSFFAAEGIRKVIYATGYKGDQIALWCESSPMSRLSQLYLREMEPLDTGGAVLNAYDLFGDWVLVSNGDSLCLGGVGDLISLAERNDVSGGMIGLHCPDTSRFGSLSIDEKYRLTAFKEKIPGAGLINGGTYLFRKEVLNHFKRGIPLSIERDLIPALINSGHNIQVIVERDADFLDIGTPETIVQAEGFIRENKSSFKY